MHHRSRAQGNEVRRRREGRGRPPRGARWRLSVLLAFVLAPIGGAQSSALTLFDEVAGHLTRAYAGPRAASLVRDLPAARAELEGRCAHEPSCAVATGVAALEELLAALGDPHTRLLNVEAFARVQRSVQPGSMELATGAILQPARRGLGLVVTDVLDGSPAVAVGLSRGDRLLALDGVYLPADPARRLAAWDAAVAESGVRVRLVRDAARVLDLRLDRAWLNVERRPRLTWLASDVAWLRVPTLLPAQVVARDAHSDVADAMARGTRAVVLDLRDDRGGAYCEAVALAGAFVDRVERVFLGPSVRSGLRFEMGTLTFFDPYGSGVRHETLPTATRWDGPLAVLVNTRTASCAESVALELQRSGAPVIGEPTAGLADVAVALVPLTDGLGLAVTVAIAFDEDGRRLPAHVMPDVLVDDDLMALAAGRDPVLEAALAILGHAEGGWGASASASGPADPAPRWTDQHRSTIVAP